MILNLVSAIMFGWVAIACDRSDLIGAAVCIAFLVGAVFNAAAAGPMVVGWLQ